MSPSSGRGLRGLLEDFAAEVVDGVMDYVRDLGVRECTICRWPFDTDGKVRAECNGNVCSDCCARLHNHTDRPDILGDT